MKIDVCAAICVGCGRCSVVCPVNLFTWQPGDKASCEATRGCIHCGHCASACPSGAIVLDGVDPATLLPVREAPLSADQRTMLFRARRSIRSYRPGLVPHALLDEALLEASYAPTASNRQCVTWLLLETPAILRAVVAETVEWLRNTGDKRYSRYAEAYDAGAEPVLRGADQAIFACTPADWAWGPQDASAAVSYLELALHSRGVGTCWTGLVIMAAREGAVPSLGLSEGQVIHAGLMVGYPALAYSRIPERKPVRLTVY